MDPNPIQPPQFQPDPTLQSSPPKNKSIQGISVFMFVILTVVVVGSLFLLQFLLQKKSSSTPVPNTSDSTSTSTPALTPTSTPSPTPSPKPIPHGKIGFSVSQNDKTKPQFSLGEIDPYDPPKGGQQSVTISVRDEQPVSQVTAVLKTDGVISQPISFKLINGSNTNGVWQGSWTVTDTYLYTYNLVLIAVSSRGQSSVEITLR